MAELTVQSFREKHGDTVAAIIQIAFLGDVDHSENLEIEQIARRQRVGDCCMVPGYIVLSDGAAVEAIKASLPAHFKLFDVMAKLRIHAEKAPARGGSLMARSGYATSSPDTEFRRIQETFRENTGFRGLAIYNAIKV